MPTCQVYLEHLEDNRDESLHLVSPCTGSCQAELCEDLLEKCRADDAFSLKTLAILAAVIKIIQDVPLGSIFPKIPQEDRQKTFTTAPMAILLDAKKNAEPLGASCMCCQTEQADCNFYVVLGESESALKECAERCKDSIVVEEPAPFCLGECPEAVDYVFRNADRDPCFKDLKEQFPDLDEDLTRWTAGDVSMDELEEEYPSVTKFCREMTDLTLEGTVKILETCKNCDVDNPNGDEIVSIVPPDGTAPPDGTGVSTSLWIGLAVVGGVLLLLVAMILGWRAYKRRTGTQ